MRTPKFRGSKSVTVQTKNVFLETGKNVVNAKHAVLCTNGYNDLLIEGIGTSITMRGLWGS